MTDRLTFEELLEKTRAGKHEIRFRQKQGFFIPDSDGLYDPKWVEVCTEQKQYVRAGFDDTDAYCEANYDVFGKYPDWYQY